MIDLCGGRLAAVITLAHATAVVLAAVVAVVGRTSLARPTVAPAIHDTGR